MAGTFKEVWNAILNSRLEDPADVLSGMIPARPVLTPEDFGATGGSNDTAAMQEAFDTAPALSFKPNRTYTSDTLTFSNGQSIFLYGNGATLKLLAGANDALMRHPNTSNGLMTRLVVRDLIFDGNKANQSAFITALVEGYFDTVLFDNCWFKDAIGDNIRLRHIARHGVIDKCRFFNGAEHTGTVNENTIYISLTEDPNRLLTEAMSVHITNNLLEGITPSVAGRGVGGILAAGNSSLTAYQSHCLYIAGNTIKNCGQYEDNNKVGGIHLYRRGSRSIITGNRLLGGQEDGIHVQGSLDVVVDGNVIDGFTDTTNGGGRGISAAPRDGDKVCEGIAITNNVIRNTAVAVSALHSEGLVGRDIHILHNLIDTCEQAIRVEHWNGSVKVNYNTVRNVTDSAPSTGQHCVTVSVPNGDTAPTADIDVIGNRIENSDNNAIVIRNQDGSINCSDNQVNDAAAIRSMSFINCDGDIVAGRNVLVTVSNDVFNFDTCTGRIVLTDNIAPAGATVRLAGGSAFTTYHGNSWNASISGVYTPTLTNVANLAASTAYECQYLRVGNTVTVSGKVDVDPTLTATATQLGISLPIASNFGTQQDCAGAAFASGIAGQGAAIRADTTNDRAEMTWVAGDVTNQPMYFSFSYQVI